MTMRRNITDAARAVCQALSQESDSMEADLRRKLENGAFIVAFADDYWGDSVCADRILGTGQCTHWHRVGWG